MQENIDIVLKRIVEFAPSILGALAVLVIGWWVISLVTRGISKVLDKANIEPSLKTFAISLLNIGLKIMLIISSAGVLGVETTSFVAILGAASFAVGLALQGSLGNFAGGALILFFKPFRVGDMIEAQGFRGIVQEIQIFTTIIGAPGGKKIIVPNGVLSNGSITNLSAREGNIMCLDLTFGIGYTDDIDKARSVIQQVIDECPYLLKEKGADIYVAELADSSVNFIVRPWVTVATYWEAYFFMHENIKKSFDREKVGIPFPQMDVHVHNVK
jgi:small conductance mechanosensitive channel